MDKIKAALDEGKTVRSVELSDDEKDMIKEMNFLTMKPTLYVANVGEDVDAMVYSLLASPVR